MKREDIIRMAREAGFDLDGMANMLYTVRGNYAQLEHFASLVAAAEREKLAQWMIQRSYATGHGDTTEDLLCELAWQADERIALAVAAEREACAQLADDPGEPIGQKIAVAIRARRNNAP